VSIHDLWPQHGVPRPELEHPALTPFGERLRSFRHSRGWTQALLGARADMSQQQIQHLERGSRRPTFTTLNRLSAALNVPVQVLIGSEMVSGNAEDWRKFWAALDAARRSLDALDAAARVLSEY